MTITVGSVSQTWNVLLLLQPSRQVFSPCPQKTVRNSSTLPQLSVAQHQVSSNHMHHSCGTVILSLPTSQYLNGKQAK